jgi:hypothetical protein
MPRIRYLKPDFFKDEDLAELPFEVRLFYAGLWCQADKAGRLEDRPKRLKAEIFPYDKVDSEKCLEILSRPKPASGRPFIHRYISGGQPYIQIISWSEHQKPHHTERDSEIPPAPPNTEKGTEKGMEKENQLEASTELSNGALTVKEPEKIQLLDFVRLTQTQYDDLVTRFGKEGADARIQELNNGIGSKGYKYKSHYHTILSWEHKHKREASSQGTGDRNVRQRDFSQFTSKVGITVSNEEPTYVPSLRQEGAGDARG